MCVCVWGGGAQGVWELSISCSSCYKPKTALKSFFKKAKIYSKFMLSIHLNSHFETMGKFWIGEIQTVLIGEGWIMYCVF